MKINKNILMIFGLILSAEIMVASVLIPCILVLYYNYTIWYILFALFSIIPLTVICVIGYLLDKSFKESKDE